MATTQGIKLDEGIQKRLKNLSQLRDRTPHWLMKEAIERYLNVEERYEQEKQEDMARWEANALTGVAVSQADAMTWLEKLAQGEAAACPK